MKLLDLIARRTLRTASAERFSTQHPFSRAEIEATVEAVATEQKHKSLLIAVTTAYREVAIRHMKGVHLAYAAAVAGIFFAQQARPTVSEGTTLLWLLVAVAAWLIRQVPYARVFRVAPAEVAKSMTLRLTPLVLIATSCAFWLWTLVLFVGPALDLTTFAIFSGFVMLSIAMIGLYPTIPLPATIYLAALWGGLSIRLNVLGTVPIPVILMMNVSVGVVAWIYVYVTVMQIKPQLARSDQVDLLLGRLNQKNRDLNDALATLDRRSAFFAAASHDFRQRLHGLMLMAHSTIVGLSPQETSRRTLLRLCEEVESLESYFTDVLDFEKVEALDQGTQLRVVKLQAIFQRLDVHFESRALAEGTALRFRRTRLSIHTDPALLQRILDNLISNAIKFTRKGVLVAARKHGECVAIEVWDQGPGIDEAERHLIFQAFHQNATTAYRGQRGVGLGLTVVKRFTAALGYQVTLRSTVGRGSVFRVIIPPSSLAS